MPGLSEQAQRQVLGTPLQITTYDELTAACQQRSREPGCVTIDFSNTQIITMRRHEPAFHALTAAMDYFIPDGMPLIWCMNWQGAGVRDRVYGPTFMRRCVLASPAPLTHYFLGGSADCLARLEAFFLRENPAVRIVGSHHGYFKADESDAIVAEINRLSPDFVWIGLGTPKQQEWIFENKARIQRGVVLAVGFAFDVNAGTKSDAPLWMQRLGLTWIHRIASEPRRLLKRYARYNSLFVFYLVRDALVRR